ncbi:MAG TPA: biotin carboxylase N-terminal domain-containing protein [Candidatus Limnocylindrales bacterium]|nr:biotin carboxylase N-terminal domain-containing protein [Candidatus Limnocylindrales bacterium]
MTKPIRKLLIANRSEIACRIAQTAREMAIATVAIHSEPDTDGEHVRACDEAVALGGRTSAESYLDVDKILAAARTTGADAIHPGYGFLAENASFARRVEEAGLTFVGPTPDAIDAMGDKIRARTAAERAGVPVLPSAEVTTDEGRNREAAEALGFPVLVKAAAGGGGRGMRRVDDAASLADAIRSAEREAGSAFGDARVYMEKFVVGPRHIEIQVFGDTHGHVLHLGERECSVQRRHQKIIEEAPSPVVSADMREKMGSAAAGLASSIGYRGAGTVEFVVAPDGNFYFLEVNTRLQVEHAVTEAITSTDLVRWQLEIAAGAKLPEKAPSPRGHAIECRVCAEDPANGFLPSLGLVRRVEHPRGVGVRVDTALRDGWQVPVEYDSMLAKVIAWAPDRTQATRRMIEALEGFPIAGFTTNVAFLIELLRSERFARAEYFTTTLDSEYQGWKPDDAEALDTVAAAVAMLARNGRTRGAGAATHGTSERMPTPWDTLGEWRLGRAKAGA